VTTWAAPLAAQEAAGGRHVEGLGTVDFPVSATGEARRHFTRGVLLLHSFEYGDAAAAFRRAQEADPDFALAYWGEAMTYNHPLWRQQDRAAAQEALRGLAPTAEERRAMAATDREKAYLEAVEVLYGDGPKARRDTLYSRAMERLVARFPEDDEARAFYALSLLGLNQGERDVPTFVRAGAIALELFEEHPRHPGAVHYAIHSFDDPTHAPLGLEAARAYSEIAPRAAHAQHMTSHIFLALGMWEDVVEANEAAARTTARDAGHDLELHPCGHYAEWLVYGYLQQGRPSAARGIIENCAALPADGGGSPGSVARMRALYLVDTGAWDGPVAGLELDPAALPSRWRLAARFGDGLAAARRGEREAAREALSGLEGEIDGLREGLAADGRVMARTLRAAALSESGDTERALEVARRAAELAEEQAVPYGPPSTYKPPRELEGEILLDAGRPEEARTAFRRALRRTPRRARSLLGLARAAAASGHTAEAARAYAEVEAVWSRAEEGWPGLREAREYLAEHGRPDAGGEPVALPR
jgi:tetratricopeptide (TPR) repeat protein